MTARWHVGPITGWDFWWLLVTSPEILDLPLLHDHRPEDDVPKRGLAAVRLRGRGRAARDAADRAADDRVRDEGRRRSTALALVCAARGVYELVGATDDRAADAAAARTRAAAASVAAGAALVGALAYAAPRRRRRNPGPPGSAEARVRPTRRAGLPAIRSSAPARTSRRIDQAIRARRSPATSSSDLRTESDCAAHPRPRSSRRPPPAGRGSPRCGRRSRAPSCADDGGAATTSSAWSLSPASAATYQGRRRVVANLQGTLRRVDLRPGTRTFVSRRRPACASGEPSSFALENGRYRIISLAKAASAPAPPAAAARRRHARRHVVRERRAPRSGSTSARARSGSACPRTRRR